MPMMWLRAGVLVLLFSFLATDMVAQTDSLKATDAIAAKKFKRLAKKENTIVIDVRTPEEYSAGSIPGAILLDYKAADFEKNVQSLDKSRHYLLYCRTGKRSANAVELFRQQGFKKVYHLLGGIENWKDPLHK